MHGRRSHGRLAIARPRAFDSSERQRLLQRMCEPRTTAVFYTASFDILLSTLFVMAAPRWSRVEVAPIEASTARAVTLPPYPKSDAGLSFSDPTFGDASRVVDGCSDDAKFVYVVSTDRALRRFEPSQLTFAPVGRTRRPLGSHRNARQQFQPRRFRQGSERAYRDRPDNQESSCRRRHVRLEVVATAKTACGLIGARGSICLHGALLAPSEPR